MDAIRITTLVLSDPANLTKQEIHIVLSERDSDDVEINLTFPDQVREHYGNAIGTITYVPSRGAKIENPIYLGWIKGGGPLQIDLLGK
jgi:hypothetical protein